MKREITPIGKALRKLRIELDENLSNMGARLGVSSAYLSAFEVGRKSPPEGIARKVAAAYRLDRETTDRLVEAEDMSRQTFTLKPNSKDARQTIALLARNLDNLTEAELNRIRQIAEKNYTEKA